MRPFLNGLINIKYSAKKDSKLEDQHLFMMVHSRQMVEKSKVIGAQA
jgi:hypothetical protein